MMGAGVARFLWPPGFEGEAPPEPWRFYLFGVMGAGFVLLIGPEVGRSHRRSVRGRLRPWFRATLSGRARRPVCGRIAGDGGDSDGHCG